ncbi:MAG: DNA polymerase III subunit alpha [Bacteroidales bacterium]|jgi:DNA polymerase-3 subunit alpha|nr:DNA polymerase III subunit alpha [Bacteroidales bacterium]
MLDFTHLHVHTRYSILDGMASIKSLVEKVTEAGMDALAITDHGNMYGVVEFVSTCDANGIKPIVGCEMYVAENSRFDKKGTEDRSGYHLIVLAKNEVGYHNLVRLCSLGFLEGFYYKPRIDHELLEKYHEGLIVCSACIAGEIPQLILSGQDEKLHESISFFKRVFGDDYYFECQNHGIDEQEKVRRKIAELSLQYGIKCIATNDIHFVSKDDYKAHDILIRVNTNTKISEYNKLSYSGEEYMKTAEEMAELFPDNPEWLTNTREIVDKVESFKITRPVLLPKFDIPAEFNDENEYLRHLVYEGTKERYGDPLLEQVKERIEFELDTVRTMGFPGYFLIVWDLIKKAREMGVRVGPGRGSAAGSVIAYALHITNLDPLQYGLLFERFLNPERISLPDVDIDFDDAGREKVIDYVRNKYGHEKVAQVITYGSMAARSALNDVSRILEVPLSEAQQISKIIPNTPGITLKTALEIIPEFSTLYEKSTGTKTREVIDNALKLEGCNRSTGVHACAMIIAPENIIDYVPLATAKDSDMPVTQYEGSYVENVGLLKMDFLGLKNLTIIGNALKNIKDRHNIEIDIDAIPLDDEKTFHLFGNGETTGIFQFESDGMRKHLRELKPTRFEDLIAMNALYRPGPMEYIPTYIMRKHGLEKIEYDLDDMKDVLEETYGVTVYQEQVMLLSRKLADFTRGEADSLRKIMGKKKKEDLPKWKEKFLAGCAKHNYDPKICEKIWKDWEAFASYAFNKSHAACYAYIAYQTAYLKAHYPEEYMAAVLTSNLGNVDQIAFFIDDCFHHKIKVLSPDINKSVGHFSVGENGGIRFGINGLKGVGAGVVEDIVRERNEHGKYKDIIDFITRIDLKTVNRKAIEALVKAGAFDVFGKPSRNAYFYKERDADPDFVEQLLQFARKSSQNVSVGSLFDDETAGSAAELALPDVEEWDELVKLMHEKEVAGYYISGHPLSKYYLEIEQFSNANVRQIDEIVRDTAKFVGRNVRFAGLVSAVEHRQTKYGKNFGQMTLTDKDGSVRLALFGETYMKFRHLLDVNTPVFILAAVVQRGFGDSVNYELMVTEMFLLDELLDKFTRHIKLEVELSQLDTTVKDGVKSLIEKYRAAKSSSKTADITFIVKDVVAGLSVTMPSNDTVSPAAFIRDLQQQDFAEALDVKLLQ